MSEPGKYRWERRKDPEAGSPPVQPGALRITEHPIGVLVVAGLLWISVLELPSTIAFLAVSMTLGSVIGFLLWRRHR